MIAVKQFDANLDLPYYVPCITTLVHAKMRHEQKGSYLSLQTNLSLLGLPSYLRRIDGSHAAVNIWEAHRLGYKGNEEYLGYTRVIASYDSAETALEELRNSLRRNETFLAAGTTYYLHQSGNYQNPQYIETYGQLFGVPANHWLMVIGLGGNSVLVYDPIPNQFRGKVPLDEFVRYWAGDTEIPELAHYADARDDLGVPYLLRYGYSQLRINKCLSQQELQELFFRCVRTVAHEYIIGQSVQQGDDVYSFGRAALFELIADMEQAMYDESLTWAHPRWQQLDKCLFDMRFNHYFFRDLLKEMAGLFGGEYEAAVDEFSRLIKSIEMIGNLSKIQISRKGTTPRDLASVVQKLSAFLDQELDFYTRLHALHEEYPLLETRTTSAEGKEQTV